MRQVVLTVRTEQKYRPPLDAMLSQYAHLTGLRLHRTGYRYDGLVTGDVRYEGCRLYAEWLQHPEEDDSQRVYLLYTLPPSTWAKFDALPTSFWLQDDLKPEGWCYERDIRSASAFERSVTAALDAVGRCLPRTVGKLRKDEQRG